MGQVELLFSCTVLSCFQNAMPCLQTVPAQEALVPQPYPNHLPFPRYSAYQVLFLDEAISSSFIIPCTCGVSGLCSVDPTTWSTSSSRTCQILAHPSRPSSNALGTFPEAPQAVSPPVFQAGRGEVCSGLVVPCFPRVTLSPHEQ